jgi:NAD(P)-dependent dehydrogenase (short-subunit alcohol dehydrogenase family)
VVTGGGRGIGAAVARALAEAGAWVVVAARTRPEIDALAADLRALGHRAFAHPCDVADPRSVEALAAAARALGPVDILVNNAGIAPSAPLRALTLEEWNRTIAVNATGTFLCTQAFLPDMLGRGWGRVVNIASIAAITAGPYIAAYAASKHAVLGFTRAVAAEVAGQGVTINAVCPGYVDTDMMTHNLEKIAAKIGKTPEETLRVVLARVGQPRVIRPEEVAYVALTLCDDDAAGINGQALVINGGGGR